MDRRDFLRAAGATGAGLLFAERAAALGDVDPDEVVVYHGGPIHTMTPRGQVTHLALRAGWIVGVGGHAASLLRRGARGVDLDGRAVFPGFIDCHSHWFGDYQLTPQAYPPWGMPADRHASMRNAVESGWTTITEHFADQGRIDDIVYHGEHDMLPLRIAAYMPTNWRWDIFEPWYLAYAPDQMLHPRARIAGVKFFSDLIHLREPYAPCDDVPVIGDDPRGDFFWELDVLRGRLRDVHDAGYQITVHCAGDGAIDNLLHVLPGAIDRANRRRHNLTHLMLLHDAQISELRSRHLVANVQLSWFHAGEAEHLTCWFGEERLPLLGRWRDLLDADVPMCGSTDFPWGTPLLGPVARTLYTAATRRGAAGEAAAPWMERQRISTREAIRSLTSGAAWALREEQVKGRLRRGMVADLTVFDQDPLTMAPEDLLDLEVAMTMVGGIAEHTGAGHGDLAP